MRKRTTPNDPGLAEIDAWGRWFLAAHTQMLRDKHLAADVFERELADVTTLADAITARMRSDYQARCSR